MIDAKTLNNLLRYEPSTGHLFWMPRAIDYFKSGDRQKNSWSIWNSRFANKKAFTAIGNHGYPCGRLLGKGYLAHCIIWCMMTGRWPDEIDHQNGIRNDNRWGNLRGATRIDNARNTKRREGNASGVTGVYWRKRKDKWQAQITVDYKKIHLGYFDNVEDAALARKEAEREHGFHPNHGRS